ncbi:MAG: glycosyltransferase [Verrucomicrobia bacterium]|nr:glycosyltransferase [Verrucomicrobiota bacterium]
MDRPEVSVVLPVRDAGATLARAVASVRAQTMREWELLVVDDGSSDGSTDVLRAQAREDARVRMIDGGRRGLVAALNQGLAAARGKLIARMDADDEARPERLAEQVALLRARPEVGLAGCLVDFGGNRMANAGYALHVDWLNSLVTPEQIALNRFVESPLAHPSVMFRRELVEKYGGYRNGDFPEDYELWLRWLDAGVRMAKVPRVLLTWHDAPARLSRTDARYEPEKFFRTKAEWIAREVRRLGVGRVTDPPYVWIWGAGRPTRKRAAHLTAHGLRIAGYIDVDAKKTTAALGGTGAPVVGLEAIPPPTEALVLGYVAARGARELIRSELGRRGFVEGRDFLMCA